jgi:nucleoside-diphosphate-sugar epimerase
MTTLKTAVQFLAHPNPYDSSEARRRLGWRPGVAALEALTRTARWIAAH